MRPCRGDRDPPKSTDAHRGWSSSAAGWAPTTTRAPYLPHVRALLRGGPGRGADAGSLPRGAVAGRANGGRVAEPRRPGVRRAADREAAAATDPLFGSLPITPDVMQWHFDAVTTCRPGRCSWPARRLCENQAFRLGRLAWGIQFHIETTPQIVRDWAGRTRGARRLRRRARSWQRARRPWTPTSSRSGSRSPRAFAAVVRDPERAAGREPMPTSHRRPGHRPGGDPGRAGGRAHRARQPTVLPMPGRPPAQQCPKSRPSDRPASRPAPGPAVGSPDADAARERPAHRPAAGAGGTPGQRSRSTPRRPRSWPRWAARADPDSALAALAAIVAAAAAGRIAGRGDRVQPRAAAAAC